MKKSANIDLLTRYSEFITSRTAIHFPPERWNDLMTKTELAAQKFGYGNAESFIHWLISNPVSRDQIEILASYLTIGESYFWREPCMFDALIQHILPELIITRERSSRVIRIWSAGCATGEEPYSIAIALRELIPDPDNWHITILATDINPDILRKAVTGLYGEWSFRNTPHWLTSRYFVRNSSGKMQVIPAVRKMVAFSYLNLAEDIYPSQINNTAAMDIIFCRNVLMYFSREKVRQVVSRLSTSLTGSGWLIVSSSELSHNLFAGFTSVNFPGTIIYRKEDYITHAEQLFSADSLTQYSNPFPPTFLASINGDGVNPDSASQPEGAAPVSSYSEILCGDTTGHRLDTENTICEAADSEDAVPSIENIHKLADAGELDDALALCDKAIEANRLDPALYYLRGVILQELNSYDEAMLSLKRMLYLDPENPLAYFTLGNLSLRKGDTRSADKYFRTVLLIINNFPDEEILPGSGGLTAGRFGEIIHATIRLGAS